MMTWPNTTTTMAPRRTAQIVPRTRSKIALRCFTFVSPSSLHASVLLYQLHQLIAEHRPVALIDGGHSLAEGGFVHLIDLHALLEFRQYLHIAFLDHFPLDVTVLDGISNEDLLQVC